MLFNEIRTGKRKYHNSKKKEQKTPCIITFMNADSLNGIRTTFLYKIKNIVLL